MAAQVPVPGCARHKKTVFVYLCINCDEELICSKCVNETHKGHTFAKIDDVVSDKKMAIQHYIDKVINSENPGLEDDINNTEKDIKQNGQTLQNLISDVKRQAHKMKNIIDKQANKIIQMCYELEKSNDNMLKTYRSALESLKNQSAARVKECHQILNSGTNIEVVEKAKEIRKRLGHPIPKKLKTVEFLPGPISESQFQHLFGCVTLDGQGQQYQSIRKTEVVSEFTNKTYMNTCRATADSAWFSYFSDNLVCRMDQRGNVEEKIDCNVTVSNIAVSPTTGRVWFCCKEGNSVREVMNSNKIVTRFATDSAPISLCITLENTIVVGMLGKVTMYTSDGQEVESARAGGPCMQVATWPWHMAYCTQTGDIAFSDPTTVTYDNRMVRSKIGDRPHIKVMDKYLNLKFQYEGQKLSSSSKQDDKSLEDTQRTLIYPMDVCFDSKGNVLVVEQVGNCVIMLDGVRGEYIKTIYTDNDVPFSISFQADGTLWVGLYGRKVKIIKYL